MTSARLALLAGLVAVAGCNLDTSNRVTLPPQLKLANGSTTTTGVHLYLRGEDDPLLAVPLAPESSEPSCLFVLNGNHTFDFVQNDTLYASVQGGLVTNASYLVVLVSQVTPGDTVYRTIVAGDDAEPTTGNYGLRLINGTNTAGDIYVTTLSDNPTAATRVAANVPPAATAAQLSLAINMIPEGRTRVRLFDVGATTNPRADILITDTDLRRITTVVLTEKTFTADQGGFQVNACQ